MFFVVTAWLHPYDQSSFQNFAQSNYAHATKKVAFCSLINQ